ncbi:MAG: tRNA (adenosine(37)-N6)-threonylcarbamoyltransferase complex ATPase subunit type 1 TsaE [Acidiferrobacterales bacterium]
MVARVVADADAMETLGASLARALNPGQLIFLHGELGSGKTTLVRGLLHALGYAGVVKSPTYTLVEPYALACGPVYHFDLYRMRDPEELEFLGIRDYLEGDGMCLLEWPERGAGILPQPDVDVFIDRVDYGRTVRLVSNTDNGAALLGGLR